MPSKQSILNEASSLIGGERIEDPKIVYGGKTQRLISLYDAAYEQALSLWPWTCVRKRVLLTPEETAPDWGFSYQFVVEENTIAPQAVMTGGGEWEFEGHKILCDSPGPLKALVSIVQKEELLHPLVASVVAYHLALTSVMGVSDSATLQQTLMRKRQEKLVEAANVENSIGSSLAKLGSEWVTAMQTGYAPELRVSGVVPPASAWLDGV